MQNTKCQSEINSHLKADNPLFQENLWYQLIPHQWRINTSFIELSQQDIQFLTDDNTSPNCHLFSKSKILNKLFKDNSFFLKVGGRVARDCSQLMNKIGNVVDLVMLIKMSEYLTEGILKCVQSQKHRLCLVLRQYLDELVSGDHQFRVYCKHHQVVGICQKNPNFIAQSITKNQIVCVQQIAKHLNQVLMKETQQKEVEFSIDLYCSPNGKTVFVLSIEQYNLHPLSLFSLQELDQHYELIRQRSEKGLKTNPLIKIVENKEQMKQIDLSDYKMGAELDNIGGIEDWISFLKGQQ